MKYLIGEGCWGPIITMIQKSVPQKKFINFVSAYQFFYIVGGCLATIIFGGIVNFL